jgi:hypothetical protein
MERIFGWSIAVPDEFQNRLKVINESGMECARVTCLPPQTVVPTSKEAPSPR